jgi:hypothetical protein
VGKMKKNLSQMIEDALGTESKFMVYSLIAATLLLVSIGFVLGSENASFLGIAESREININFENAVEIKTVHVTPGQRVNKGEILLELNQTEVDTRLRALKAQVTKINAELRLRDKLTRLVSKKKQAPVDIDPLRIERSQLFSEIGHLENQKRALFVFSEIDGIIGTVNFKAGEKAPAFASLITISPVNPSYVLGYVHESAHNKVVPHQKVKVTSPASGKEVMGEVVTVGARIVPIPERLLRIAKIESWGREILVKLPEENGFLLSERVQIKPALTLGIFATAMAEDDSETRKPEFVDLVLPYGLSTDEMFEPSGMIWVPELNNYVVASDEIVVNGVTSLIMVGKDGRVSDQLLTIENVPKIDDMESISLDGETIYVLGSLSNTKKGLRDADREIFARVERKGLRLTATGSVNLRNVLETALANSVDGRLEQISQMISAGDLNVEGHAVRNGVLYLAMKAPQPEKNRGLILQIDGIDAVFSGKPIPPNSVSIYDILKFKTDKTGFNLQISDIVLTPKGMFVATTCQGDSCSALWQVDGQNKKPTMLAFFKKKQLEGISYDPASSTVTGIFDQGGKPTQMVRIKLK